MVMLWGCSSKSNNDTLVRKPASFSPSISGTLVVAPVAIINFIAVYSSLPFTNIVFSSKIRPILRAFVSFQNHSPHPYIFFAATFSPIVFYLLSPVQNQCQTLWVLFLQSWNVKHDKLFQQHE